MVYMMEREQSRNVLNADCGNLLNFVDGEYTEFWIHGVTEYGVRDEILLCIFALNGVNICV